MGVSIILSTFAASWMLANTLEFHRIEIGILSVHIKNSFYHELVGPLYFFGPLFAYSCDMVAPPLCPRNIVLIFIPDTGWLAKPKLYDPKCDVPWSESWVLTNHVALLWVEDGQPCCRMFCLLSCISIIVNEVLPWGCRIARKLNCASLCVALLRQLNWREAECYVLACGRNAASALNVGNVELTAFLIGLVGECASVLTRSFVLVDGTRICTAAESGFGPR
jgi:hypothetical protein